MSINVWKCYLNVKSVILKLHGKTFGHQNWMMSTSAISDKPSLLNKENWPQSRTNYPLSSKLSRARSSKSSPSCAHGPRRASSSWTSRSQALAALTYYLILMMKMRSYKVLAWMNSDPPRLPVNKIISKSNCKSIRSKETSSTLNQERRRVLPPLTVMSPIPLRWCTPPPPRGVTCPPCRDLCLWEMRSSSSVSFRTGHTLLQKLQVMTRNKLFNNKSRTIKNPYRMTPETKNCWRRGQNSLSTICPRTSILLYGRGQGWTQPLVSKLASSETVLPLI